MGPTFENSLGIAELDGSRADVAIYRSQPGGQKEALQQLHAVRLAP